MKRIGTTSLMLFCIWSLIFGQVPDWDWVTALHSPDSEVATDVAADPITGDVYLVGEWTGSLVASIPLGGTESTDFTDTYGGADGFVVKLDKNGNFQWAFKMGGEGDDLISAVHLDSDGNLYITGKIASGEIRFSGTGSLTADSVYTNSRPSAFYLVKYDPEGKLLWARYSTGNAKTEGFGICSNSSGVFACGYFKNALTLGSITRTSVGDEAIFLVKYTPDGDEEWLLSGNSWDWDYGRVITCDDANIYIAGEFYGDQLRMSNAAGDVVATLPNSSEGKSEIFISCYSNEGLHLWSSSVASPEDDYCKGITMDNAKLYLTGSIGAPAIFPLYPGNPVSNTGNQDAFLCAISRTDGSTGWVRTLTGASGNDQVSNDVSMDLAGNLYITGYYQSEIHADPDTESSRGNEDVFVASYSMDGVYRWLKTAGSSNTDHGSGISGVYPGSVFVAGGYSSDLASFDAINLPADGNMNAFVGRLQLPCSDAVGGTLSVSDTAVCDGEILSLALEGYFGDISWQSSPPGMNTWSQLTADLFDSIAFIPSSSADYRVLLTSDTCGANSSNIMYVEVIPLPPADAGSNITITVGDTIQLNGSGGDSVRWDPDYRLSDPTLPDPFADPSVTTTYYLTAMGPNGCSAMDSMIVTVISCIDAVGGTLSVSDTAVCEGEELSLALEGYFGQIQWQSSPPGMNTWSLQSADLSDSIAFIPSFSADYRVLLTSGICEADSSNVMYVRVRPLPLVDAGSNITINAGDTIQLNGSIGDSVRWDPDYRVSDATLPDPFADPWITTAYYLTIMDSHGCSAMDSVIVTVIPCFDAVSGTLTVSDTAVCEGEELSLALEGYFGDISWQSSPPGMNTWSLLTTDLSDSISFIPSFSADYRVLLTASICEADSSKVIHVGVFPFPIADAGSNVTINVGDTIQLNGSGSDSVRWDPDYRLSDPTLPDPFADPSVTTTYYLTALGPNGCSTMDSVIVTVISCFDAVGGTLSVSDTAVCEGEMLSLAIKDYFGQVQWQSSPPGMNTWSLLTTDLSDSIGFIPSFSADYRALLTSDTCASDSSNVVHAQIIPLPLVDAGSNITIDVGDTIQLNGSGGDSVRWDPDYRLSDPTLPDPIADPWVTTTYLLTAFVSNGCYATDSVTITVRPPDFANAGSDQTICQGDSTRLQASGGILYNWEPIGSLDLYDIPNPWASPQITTTYVVRVTNAVGLIDTDTVTVIVHSRPTVLAGEDISVCKGIDAQLSASGTGDFAWFPQAQVDDPTQSETMTLVDATTTFRVVLTDLNGCSSTAYVTVFVVDPPLADAGPDQELTSRFESDLEASIGSGETGRWSVVLGYAVFTDPQSPTTRVVDLEIGENIFEWELSNGVCPEVSDQVSIKVTDFVIPTVITPNDDGKNDLFHVESIENFTASELVVLDRWGFEVYRSAPYLNNWGGTDQNMEALTEGTYYIILKITDNDIRKGYVMILR